MSSYTINIDVELSIFIKINDFYERELFVLYYNNG